VPFIHHVFNFIPNAIINFIMPLFSSVILLLSLQLHFCSEDPFCCKDVNCVLVDQYGDQLYVVVSRILEYCLVKNERECLDRTERLRIS
jgi:hypothetical protein